MNNENELFSKADLKQAILDFVVCKLNTIESIVNIFKKDYDHSLIIKNYSDVINYKTDNIPIQNKFDCFIKDFVINSSFEIDTIFKSSNEIEIKEILEVIVKENNNLYCDFLKQMPLQEQLKLLINNIYLEFELNNSTPYITQQKQLDI